MEDTRTVFISHKAKDFELAAKCRKAIQELLRIKVFLSEDIPKGQGFRQEIRSAIDKARYFIALH